MESRKQRYTPYSHIGKIRRSNEWQRSLYRTHPYLQPAHHWPIAWASLSSPEVVWQVVGTVWNISGRQIRPLVDALSFSRHEFPGEISTWGPIFSIVCESDWETKVSLYNILISAVPVTPQTTKDSSKSVYFYFLICLNYKIKWLCCYVTETRKFGDDMCSREISFVK